MPVQGWFSDGFGWRKDPRNGERRFHRGIDIVADRGTPILAPADGLVARASRAPDYGKMIDLSHGYGYVTRYGHLSEILVRPGQSVRRGDVIGRVGSTGRSTGPHLHYEVIRDGRRVNPWKYLGQKGR
jgi:murein DD-endopeptidase MepM/ murein hydrolase activator NlpD